MKKQIKNKSLDLFKRSARYFLPSHKTSKKVFINTFPKSGTHLLKQIIEQFNPFKYRGVMVADYSSLTGKRRKQKSLSSAINNSKKNEILYGHIFYNEQIEKDLDSNNFKNILLIRDLRNVVISEANWYTNMNKFNHMHKRFKSLSSDEERISLCINGFEDQNIYYPNIRERFANYFGWLESESVLKINYENLIDKNRINLSISDIYEFCTGSKINESTLMKIKKGLNSQKSHTFNKKRSNYETMMTKRNLEDFEKIAGDLNRSLNYK